MKIILATDIDTLGRKGDIVSVADGYARNFLVPRGHALVATKGNLKQAELMQKAREEKERKLRDEASARVARLEGSPIYISARAGEGGRLFGSVTNSDIARAMKEQIGEEVDRHKVRLDDPIRELGTHTVSIQIHGDISARVSVEVIEHVEEEE